MQLDETSTASLKILLNGQLQSICEADPAVLADYVIALLKHEKSIPDLKALCISQLDDFLKEETQPFVSTLFDSLAAEGYLAPEQGARSAANEPENGGQSAAFEEPLPVAEEAPKRRYDEEISEDEDGDRNFKHTRRGGDKESPGPSQQSQPHAIRATNEESNGRHASNVPRHELPRHNQPPNYPAGGLTTSEHKRRRSDDRPVDDAEGHRVKIARGPYPGGPHTNQFGVPPGARRDFDGRESRLGQHQPQRYPQQMPPGPMGMGMGGPSRAWESGHPPQWGGPRMGGPGMPLQGDPRFRGTGARMPDRSLSRGLRGGYANGRNRRPCRDYEEQGYCLRGDECPFDHGLDRIVVDDLPMVGGRPPFDVMGGPVSTMPVGMRNAPFQPPFAGNHTQRAGYELEAFAEPGMHVVPSTSSEGYDPERAAISVKEGADGLKVEGLPAVPAPLLGMPMVAYVPGAEQMFRGTGRGRGGFQQRQHQGYEANQHDPSQRGRGAFAAGFQQRGNFNGQQQQGMYGSRGGGSQQHGRQQYGTSNHRTNDTLVVENIPAEHMAIDKISAFFGRFGTLTNIKLAPQQSRAILQFAQHSQAYAAYKSPEPIFENRFVKMFWAAPEHQSEAAVPDIAQGPGGSGSAVVGAISQAPPPRRSFVINNNDASPGPVVPTGPTPEELAAAKALAEEKKEKAKQMLELQQSLIAKQLEEQKKIMEKLQSKTVGIKEKQALMKQFEILSKSLKEVMQSAATTVSNAAAQNQSQKLAAMSREDRERERLDKELDQLTSGVTAGAEGGADVTSGPDSNLVAHLEALKAQAAERGIDPAAVIAADGAGRSGHAHYGAPYAPRGRHHPYAGAWGGGRGGGAPGGRMTLDNRPTKIQVKGLAETAHLGLKSHFENVGAVKNLAFSDNNSNAIVEFVTRRDAERALSEPMNFPGSEAAEMS
ncbi:RNA-binding protein 27, partial [Thoreauomyces humboldtii]